MDSITPSLGSETAAPRKARARTGPEEKDWLILFLAFLIAGGLIGLFGAIQEGPESISGPKIKNGSIDYNG